MGHKVFVYKEYYPRFLISPRWLAILIEAILTIAGLTILIVLLALYTGTEDFIDMVIFALLILIPLFLIAIFYKVRIYSDGTLAVFLCGSQRKIAISDITKIYPAQIMTRLHNLTYYNCILKNGKNIMLNVEDLDDFLKELKLYNNAIEFLSDVRE